MHILQFRIECTTLARERFLGCRVKVEEFDYGCKRGVAIEFPDGRRHGVRGFADPQFYPWRWYRPWRRSRTVEAMTPAQAFYLLEKWEEERQAEQQLVASIVTEERELTALGVYG